MLIFVFVEGRKKGVDDTERDGLGIVHPKVYQTGWRLSLLRHWSFSRQGHAQILKAQLPSVGMHVLRDNAVITSSVDSHGLSIFVSISPSVTTLLMWC